jgi:nucleotide-binding universal stress UspA family protein
MIKKILVPLDGSKVAEQILPYACLLAEAYQVPVELLSVDETASGAAFSTSAGAMAYLNKVVTESFPASLHVDAVLDSGKAAEAIVDRAKGTPGCLIALATHGQSGIKRWLMGGVATKVVQGSHNSVLLVRAAETPPAKEQVKITSVIVPLDGSELAESALLEALDLAKNFGGEIVLARAFQVPPTAYYQSEDVPPAAKPFIPTYDDLVADMKREAGEYLDAKGKELAGAGVKVRKEVLIGPAAEEIVKLARDTKGSLIAMCTHGRSGVRRWLLGSVTEKAVNHAESPMLIIRAR